MPSQSPDRIGEEADDLLALWRMPEGFYVPLFSLTSNGLSVE